MQFRTRSEVNMYVYWPARLPLAFHTKSLVLNSYHDTYTIFEMKKKITWLLPCCFTPTNNQLTGTHTLRFRQRRIFEASNFSDTPSGMPHSHIISIDKDKSAQELLCVNYLVLICLRRQNFPCISPTRYARNGPCHKAQIKQKIIWKNG